jgi:hypothetical protein
MAPFCGELKLLWPVVLDCVTSPALINQQTTAWSVAHALLRGLVFPSAVDFEQFLLAAVMQAQGAALVVEPCDVLACLHCVIRTADAQVGLLLILRVFFLLRCNHSHVLQKLIRASPALMKGLVDLLDLQNTVRPDFVLPLMTLCCKQLSKEVQQQLQLGLQPKHQLVHENFLARFAHFLVRQFSAAPSLDDQLIACLAAVLALEHVMPRPLMLLENITDEAGQREPTAKRAPLSPVELVIAQVPRTAATPTFCLLLTRVFESPRGGVEELFILHGLLRALFQDTVVINIGELLVALSSALIPLWTRAVRFMAASAPVMAVRGLEQLLAVSSVLLQAATSEDAASTALPPDAHNWLQAIVCIPWQGRKAWPTGVESLTALLAPVVTTVAQWNTAPTQLLELLADDALSSAVLAAAVSFPIRAAVAVVITSLQFERPAVRAMAIRCFPLLLSRAKALGTEDAVLQPLVAEWQRRLIDSHDAVQAAIVASWQSLVCAVAGNTRHEVNKKAGWANVPVLVCSTAHTDALTCATSMWAADISGGSQSQYFCSYTASPLISDAAAAKAAAVAVEPPYLLVAAMSAIQQLSNLPLVISTVHLVQLKSIPAIFAHLPLSAALTLAPDRASWPSLLNHAISDVRAAAGVALSVVATAGNEPLGKQLLSDLVQCLKQAALGENLALQQSLMQALGEMGQRAQHASELRLNILMALLDQLREGADPLLLAMAFDQLRRLAAAVGDVRSLFRPCVVVFLLLLLPPPTRLPCKRV